MSTNFPLSYKLRPGFEAQIKSIDAQIEAVKRKVAVKNTVKAQQIAVLNEERSEVHNQLRKCEPQPLSDVQAAQTVLHIVESEMSYIQENITKYLNRINADPLHGIAWDGESLIKASHKLREFKIFQAIFSYLVNNPDSYTFAEAVREFNTRVDEIKNILLGVRLAHSTSQFHNAVDNLKYETLAEVLDYSGGVGTINSTIKRQLLDAVEVYRSENEAK